MKRHYFNVSRLQNSRNSCEHARAVFESRGLDPMSKRSVRLGRRSSLCAFDTRISNDFRGKTTVLQSTTSAIFAHWTLPEKKFNLENSGNCLTDCNASVFFSCSQSSHNREGNGNRRCKGKNWRGVSETFSKCITFHWIYSCLTVKAFMGPHPSSLFS